MTNQEIAQLISERIGERPVPFEAVRQLALDIYHELGGQEDDRNFEDIFEILLSIIPLTNLINDSSIVLDKTWSSYKINSEIESVKESVTDLLDDTSIASNKTWSSEKIDYEFSIRNILTGGQNINIDSSFAINAEGYIFDSSNGAFAEKYKQDNSDGGQIVTNTATGLGSHAEGYNTTASGDYGSHAEGNMSTASGYVSHAEGNRNTASGTAAHAEGNKTTASGDESHTEGTSTAASGNNSHAEGLWTLASGYFSHAEGQGSTNVKNTASGKASHVEGSFNTAQNFSEHAEGAANVSHRTENDDENHFGNAGNTIHSIGIGRYANSRKNAIEVMQNGDMYVINVGDYQGTDTKVQNASIMTVQEVLLFIISSINTINSSIGDINSSINTINSSIGDINSSINTINSSIGDINSSIASLDERVTALEPTPPIPNDEIRYTSINGIVTPNRVSSLPTITSNTYTDGEGIMKFNQNLTSIEWFAFQECKFTSITFPDSLTTIGQSAFLNCSSLTSFNIPNSVTSIGTAAFSGCNIDYLYIPASITELGYANEFNSFANNPNLISIIVDSNNHIFDSRGNCNAIILKSNNALRAGCLNTVIPNTVTSIGGNAFSGCSNLTFINIPSSVTSIGYGAFSGCSGLTSINIPSSVNSIDYAAFAGCSGLTSITIPSSVTSIGDKAFSNCSSLTSITIPSSVTSINSYTFLNCSSLTSITILEGVTSIGGSVFSGCASLNYISIPDTVTSIGELVFDYCSNLTAITYTGTMDQWSNITKNSYWKSGSSLSVVHCSDGDIQL